jgi:hypothetical protein
MARETRERSFDELAKGLANGTISRRQALRWMGGALAGAAFASVPGVAFAAAGGDSACAEFCHANFSGREAGKCTSAGAHGTGACYDCTPGIGPGPKFVPPDCPPGQEYNPTTCACEGGACEPGSCGGGFVPCAGEGLPPLQRCLCFEVTETPGQGRCLNNFVCKEAVPCPNGTTDCPTGFTCVTNTCCGEQVCAPECGVTSLVTGQGGGLTAAGVTA